MSTLVGLISDTHGLLRPDAVEALRGSNVILHAGDVGGQDILDALSTIAPVIAVRGNNDHGEWTARLPEVARTRQGGMPMLVLHDIKAFAPGNDDRAVRMIVSGHSHKPSIEEKGGVLYINPGSAGPRRFNLPISVATVEVSDHQLHPRIVTLA